MFITDLFEANVPVHTLVIYPGRFQPWHKGHRMVYEHLVKLFGRDHVFIATSNKVDAPRSPFSFSEKVQFMNLTGVSSDRIVETRDPYRALEVVQNYNPATTRLIFAVSEKDMAEDPRFKFGTKKDGTPTYFQPLPKDANDMQPLNAHGYIMTVPTFSFTVLGEPMRSATEVRAQFAQADESTQQSIVKDLFGTYDRHVHDIMKQKLLPVVAESVAVGTKLNLVKNYGNFETLTGVVKDITPSGKLKIQITQATPVPGKKGAVRVGDVVTMASNYVKNTIAENFADGKNPQDKGDAKRYGINTKASVSSLRKTAKSGGRKGQLAHWLANMKAGRARAKNESVTGLNQQDEKFVLYFNGKPVAKFDTEIEARQQSRHIKDPNTRIEIKRELCTLTPVQLKENLKNWINSDPGVAEGSLNEFTVSGDGGDDSLFNYAKMWYNGDLKTQRQVEKALQKSGLDIGENEDENGGAYISDMSGDYYESWTAEDLEQGVAEGALNEFAPGGDSASSYYAVTANFVNEFAQQKQEELQDLIDAGWTKQDLAQAGTLQSQAADIAHFEQVRDSFLKGLKPGFDAYLKGDTQLKDQLGSYWEENDLPLNQDWEKIYGEPWGRDEYNEGVAEGNNNPYRRPTAGEVSRTAQQTQAKLNPTASKFVWKKPNQIGGSYSEQDLIAKGFKKSQYNSWGGTQAMWDRLTRVSEQLNQPTPTAQQILDKHNLTVEEFMAQLKLGVKVEFEHTKDAKTAYEIALDHLNERPNYYTVLAKTGLEEDAAGVGVVAKNKKMAKDPRYSTSMTVDVRPGTDKKNMRALRLIK